MCVNREFLSPGYIRVCTTVASENKSSGLGGFRHSVEMDLGV